MDRNRLAWDQESLCWAGVAREGALLRGGSFAGNQIRMTAKTDAVAAVGVRPAAMRLLSDYFGHLLLLLRRMIIF